MTGKIYYACTAPTSTGAIAKAEAETKDTKAKAKGRGANGQGTKHKAGVNPTWCVLGYEDRTLDTVTKVLKVRPSNTAHTQDRT